MSTANERFLDLFKASSLTKRELMKLTGDRNIFNRIEVLDEIFDEDAALLCPIFGCTASWLQREQGTPPPLQTTLEAAEAARVRYGIERPRRAFVKATSVDYQIVRRNRKRRGGI